MAADVAALRIPPGLPRRTTEAVLASGCGAVVLETLGSGNAPQLPWLSEALQRAVLGGTAVVAVTQCHSGAVRLGTYATSGPLVDAGVISGADLTPGAALTKLMHLLGRRLSGENLRLAFQAPIDGEMAGE